MSEKNNAELPYIDAAEFNEKVSEFAKTNIVLTNVFNQPPHLIQDLFFKLGCKPIVYKY